MVVTPDPRRWPRAPPWPLRQRLRRAWRGLPRVLPVRRLRRWLGVLGLLVAVGYLAAVVDLDELGAALEAVTDHPAALLGAVVLYAGAFVLRSWAWRRVLPGLSAGQSWAALHVSLLGNHVLPFRLGEALRVTSVLRRTAAAGRRRWSPRRSRCGPPTCSPCSRSRRWPRPRWPAGSASGAGLLAALLLAAGVAAVGWLVVLRRRGSRRSGCPAPVCGAGRRRSPGCWRPR